VVRSPAFNFLLPGHAAVRKATARGKLGEQRCTLCARQALHLL
jgi:hypothetical protein